jgi:hypothetical protein
MEIYPRFFPAPVILKPHIEGVSVSFFWVAVCVRVLGHKKVYEWSFPQGKNWPFIHKNLYPPTP